jgi:hypothetical protein
MSLSELMAVDIESVYGRNFVRNNGRYFTGASVKEYFPQPQVERPLPVSALLFWALQHQRASQEHFHLLQALQEYTGVNFNCWSIKHLGDRFAVEVYMIIYPPLNQLMAGRDLPAMRRSEHVTNLNYFLAFEQIYFGQEPWSVDQDRFGLTEPLFSLHFDLDDRLFRERQVEQYTMATRVGTDRPLPERPAYWEGYVWNKGEESLQVEQHGFVVEPDRHRQAMLDFIDDSCRLGGWPEERRPDPEEFLVPWLFEHTRGEFHLLGLTRKELRHKGGLGVYYRLRYPAFLRFLEEFAYPDGFVGEVHAHREELEHLLFDVALAYKMHDGRTTPARTAIYGSV